ncbi:laccase-1-like [Aphidius gifuensis]|uniref:laccase-1-like n=1 Tax=Aphidius gifuensis TaxID=684658 RepID=UPI001CDD27A4|nr:laccase-1-like [Aphidius gifuensis]
MYNEGLSRCACELCKPSTTQGLLNYPTCQCILVDGVERTVFSVNRMVPGPNIQICKNDYVVIDVLNNAEGIGVSLHYHGLFQNNYQYYDGVPYVTQCPIQGFTKFRYQFKVKQSGTYFWHSHVQTHRLDGQYGAFIIRDLSENEPNINLYDEDKPDHVIIISDWMHYLSTERWPGLKVHNGQSADNILINGRGKWTFTIEGHSLKIIAQDGSHVLPQDVDTIITSAGERVDFIINAMENKKSYWIQVRGLGECEEKKVQQFAILKYNGDRQDEDTEQPDYVDGLEQGIIYNPLVVDCDNENDSSICPSSFKTAEEFDTDIVNLKPDYQFILPFYFHYYEKETNYDNIFTTNKTHYPEFFVTNTAVTLVSLFDGVIFKTASAPPLTENEGFDYTCDKSNFKNCKPPECSCTNIKKIKLNSIVELILYDKVVQPLTIHPFHLHGHKFHVLDMGQFLEKRSINNSDITEILNNHKKKLEKQMYNLPPAKDTVLVPQSGWVILRFRANNPGFWLFHCHLDWHSTTGMQLIFQIGGQTDLPPIPDGFPTCGNFIPSINPID